MGNQVIDIAMESSVQEILETVGNINDKLDTSNGSKTHGKVMFTENGIFTVPKDVDTIAVTAIAAGAAGGNSSYNINQSPYIFAGGGGARGQYVKNFVMSVTEGENIDITVGTGNTVFGTYFTLIKGAGGGGGGKGTAGLGYDFSSGGGGGGGAGGLYAESSNGSAGGNVSDAQYGGTGGTGGGIGGASGGSGGWFRGSIGTKGGDATYPKVGGAKGGSPGGFKSGSTGSGGGEGAGGGYGAGGGGAGGGSNSVVATGGAGANGVVIIEWQVK